jgi:hypothetical protein
MVTTTPSATATPSSPVVTAREVAINCRYGPGTAWESISALTLGTVADIVGKDQDFNYEWWQIEDPLNPGGVCWVALAVSSAAGDLTIVPAAPAPDTQVTRVTVSAEVSFSGCGEPNPVALSGRITTNGPGTVRYQWVVGGTEEMTTIPESILFDSFGARTVAYEGDFAADCGTYTITLRVLGPNPTFAQESFSVPQ